MLFFFLVEMYNIYIFILYTNSEAGLRRTGIIIMIKLGDDYDDGDDDRMRRGRSFSEEKEKREKKGKKKKIDKKRKTHKKPESNERQTEKESKDIWAKL